MSLLARSLLIVLVLHFAQPVAVYAQDAQAYRGRSLQSVLDELRMRGAPLVYSSNLVPRRLRVETEPQSSEQLALARELLAPHGLAIQESGASWLVVRGAPPPEPQEPGSIALAAVALATAAPLAEAVAQLDAPAGPSAALIGARAVFAGVAPGRHVLVVRAPGYLPQRAAVDVASGAMAEVTVALAEAAPHLEELTVTASRYDLRSTVQPSASYFSQEQIESLAELGDDALRVAHRLPGIATNEFSSRSHVRGGATNEMTVILDGMKLFEPYHLRDYQSVFSAIDQRIVSGLQIYSGGFPVAYGDALSGLTVIDQVEPTETRHELGLSLLYTSVLSSGTFDDGRAQWLVSARRGNIDLLLQDQLGEPKYRDAFVHVAKSLNAKHKLAFNSIGFDDDIVLTPDDEPGETESAGSETDNHQLWFKLDSDWTPALSSRSLVYATNFTAIRRGAVFDVDEIVGFVDDHRDLEARGVKQDWEWDASARQLVTWGFETEEVDGRYAYASAVELRGVLATLAAEPARIRSAALAPQGARYAAYVGDRVRLNERAIVELGVRWDKQTYLPPGDDEQFSPRGSLLYRLGAQSDLRFSYGRFFQAESLIDLQIEDGVLAFAPAQNASHSIVGFERRFAGGFGLRVEAFRKWTTSARPRYENVFNPLVLLPELRPGRVRVAPGRAESRGLEVLVNSDGPSSWWAGYSFARAEDIVGGERVPRSWDQRHAVSGGRAWRLGPWTLSGVASMHSGWPATTLTLVPSNAPNAVDGLIAVPGARNGDRLRSVRRVDVRASRMFDAGPGTLRFFAELTNATNRANPCCVSYDPVTTPGGSLQLDRVERRALGVTGNVGVLWQF